MDSPDPEPATLEHCPSCASDSGVVCAASSAGSVKLLDVRLPGRVAWSGLWACAAGCAALGVVAWILAPSTGWYQAAGVFVIFALTFGMLGVWQTRLNRSRMLGAEPLVHKTHARALYCRACDCVYFNSRKLPAGIPVGTAMTIAEYRRRLWYACGFTKPI